MRHSSWHYVIDLLRSVGSIARVPTAQQFICKKCRSLVTIESFEQSSDGTPYCRCPNCSAKNAVVQTGVTPSQPGIVPVTRLLE
jgi:DNA-directed RNA polymerase subunit RPC12/RpoP